MARSLRVERAGGFYRGPSHGDRREGIQLRDADHFGTRYASVSRAVRRFEQDAKK